MKKGAIFLMISLMMTGQSVAADEGKKPEKISGELDEVSVTATRVERKTAEVPASIAVVTEERLKDTKMFNVKEALTGVPGVLIESSNQGYDSRLIIRGAGLKAAYGVREIMVLRDGVPVTDPDGFTRLDMIDTQLIERIEVVKGPNSTLWGANAAGGVINIISKNPLERKGGNVKLGAGTKDTYSAHVSFSDSVSGKLYYNGSFSWRQTSNSWRRWNEFETIQVSLKPYIVLGDGSTWENNISYSKADLQLPGSLNETMYLEYKDTGEANQTDSPWKYSGRYSDSCFFSSKVTKQFGNVDFIPMVYVNYWKHHHPVTGRINDADTWVMGADLQLNYHHQIIGETATLSSGVTLRYDDQETEYYQYADTRTVGNRIISVSSDRAGAHMESQTRQALLFGLYAQESFRPVPKALVDVGARLDVIDFTINSDQTSDYNWSTGAYTTFPLTNEEVSKSYTSFSPRIGASYELSELFNVFVSASTGVQSPSEGEINDNPDLELVETQSYEVGLKGRSENWNFDASVYYSPVKNEVIKVLNNGRTSYANAGKTNKQGVELSGSYTILKGLKFGASYTYSDFTFDEFSENVGFGPTARSVDRSGNRLPYVPQHQYSLFAAYKHPSGFKAKIQAHTWGSYFMDNGNTEKYDGYEFVTNLMLGYETDKYDISLNVDNLFDDRYAVEATKDLRGEKDYKPAGPRSIMLRFTYKF